MNKEYNRYTFKAKRVDNGEWVYGYLTECYGEPKGMKIFNYKVDKENI